MLAPVPAGVALTPLTQVCACAGATPMAKIRTPVRSTALALRTKMFPLTRQRERIHRSEWRSRESGQGMSGDMSMQSPTAWGALTGNGITHVHAGEAGGHVLRVFARGWPRRCPVSASCLLVLTNFFLILKQWSLSLIHI